MKAKTKIKQKVYNFTVMYEPVNKGGYQVTVPLLPGLVTYGRNFEEAKEMAHDAIACHLEGFKKDKAEIPTETFIIQERIFVALAH